jgi:chitodextrinase
MPSHPVLALCSVVLLSFAWSGASSPPVADLRGGQDPICDTGGPYDCRIGHTFMMDGRGSHDPDGTIVEYAWDFGDGGTGIGPVVSHAYAATGNFVVTLSVTDNDGRTTICKTAAEIGEGCDCPPNCDAGGPYTGIVGVPIEFDGSGSSTAFSCIPIIQYTWDFGDGATAEGPTPSHAYAIPGAYVVTLTVMDADAWASTCSTTAEVTGPQPTEPSTWGRIKSIAW